MAHRLPRKLSVTAVVFIGVMAAGIAFAAWTTTGTGSGYAKATTAQDLTTVDVSATTTATLYPGAAGDVELEISNPNDYPVRVTSVTGDGGITASDPGCNVASVTFTDQDPVALDVPATGSASFTLNGSVSMSGAANDDCQGAVFTIPVSLSGQSNVP